MKNYHLQMKVRAIVFYRRIGQKNMAEFLITVISRNTAMFYSKSANLIGFLTVVYSLIDNSDASVVI